MQMREQKMQNEYKVETLFYFEDLSIGMSARETVRITQAMLVQFAQITRDTNPVHFDEAYARKTVFCGTVVHGMLTASLLSGVLGTKLPGPGAILQKITDVVFKAPVRVGDEVFVRVTVSGFHGRDIVRLTGACFVAAQEVLSAEIFVMVPQRRHAN